MELGLCNLGYLTFCIMYSQIGTCIVSFVFIENAMCSFKDCMYLSPDMLSSESLLEVFPECAYEKYHVC